MTVHEHGSHLCCQTRRLFESESAGGVILLWPTKIAILAASALAGTAGFILLCHSSE
jgi:Na+/H+ antiporter NhaA